MHTSFYYFSSNQRYTQHVPLHTLSTTPIHDTYPWCLSMTCLHGIYPWRCTGFAFHDNYPWHRFNYTFSTTSIHDTYIWHLFHDTVRIMLSITLQRCVYVLNVASMQATAIYWTIARVINFILFIPLLAVSSIAKICPATILCYSKDFELVILM